MAFWLETVLTFQVLVTFGQQSILASLLFLPAKYTVKFSDKSAKGVSDLTSACQSTVTCLMQIHPDPGGESCPLLDAGRISVPPEFRLKTSSLCAQAVPCCRFR